VKRTEVVRRLAKAARAADVEWTEIRQGANHTIYRLGTTTIPIPRHREISEGLARAIFKEAESQLGEGWWR
jgi:hypothetical protein